jgi:NAD(P)H dehydrogenase (quinone)
MKILIILAHPDKKSFNHAVAYQTRETLEAKGHQVFFHDLYEEKFDPVLSSAEIPMTGHLDHGVQKHCEELQGADGLVVVHPNWWGQPPAILKGWIDRVIRPGIAYEFREGDSGEGIPVGLLKGKTALVFNTSNTPEEREKKEFGDPLETLWKKCVFGLCGITRFYRKMFKVMVTSTKQQRENWLEEVKQIVDRYF